MSNSRSFWLSIFEVRNQSKHPHTKKKQTHFSQNDVIGCFGCWQILPVMFWITMAIDTILMWGLATCDFFPTHMRTFAIAMSKSNWILTFPLLFKIPSSLKSFESCQILWKCCWWLKRCNGFITKQKPLSCWLEA